MSGISVTSRNALYLDLMPVESPTPSSSAAAGKVPIRTVQLSSGRLVQQSITFLPQADAAIHPESHRHRRFGKTTATAAVVSVSSPRLTASSTQSATSWWSDTRSHTNYR